MGVFHAFQRNRTRYINENPFWLIVILLFKARVFAMENLIFVGLILSGLILFLIMSIPQNTKQTEEDRQLFTPTTRVRSIYRRKFKYTAYIPEKRSGRDRRKGFDRRSSITRRRGAERRSILNNRESYPVERRDVFKKQS